MTWRHDAARTAIALSLTLSQSSAAVVHVPVDYPTIQAAIDAAAPGDTVEVACGTYYEHDIIVSKALLVRSETGLPECAIVDAQQLGRVFRCSAPQDSTTIRGLTIRGGSTLSDPMRGGGLLCERSGPSVARMVLLDCVVVANSAGSGGAMACFEVPVTIERCRFGSNIASARGGGLWLHDSPATVIDSQFEGNEASEGGGVYVDSFDAPTFAGCSFAENAASGVGGGAVADQGLGAEFDECVFTGNTAPYGGAIRGGVTNTTLRDCVVSGNTASYGGGLCSYALSNSGRFTIESTAITGNVAAVRGGGAQTGSAALGSVIRNSTIAGNAAPTGGGVAVFAVCALENSVLWGNCATAGGGLYVNQQFPSSLASFSCCEVDTSSGWLAGGGTVQWIGINGFTDPLFCHPLPCDEAPSTGGDYSLGDGSPCLPENSDGCGLIGRYALGGCTTAVETQTWGHLKGAFR